MMLELGIALYNFLYLIAATSLLVIVGVCIYDIKYASTWRELEVRGRKKLHARPHLTVLIYVRNDLGDLESCLQSIKRNRYSQYDVVVADNSSSKQVRKQIRDIFRNLHHSNIYYYANRRKVSKDSTYREAYKRSQKGELVVLITPYSTINSGVLKKLVILQSMLPSVACFKLAQPHFEELTLEAISRELILASKGMVGKVCSLFGARVTDSLQPGSMVRKDILLQKSKLSDRNMYVSRLSLSQMDVIPTMLPGVIKAVVGSLLKLAALAVVGICLWLAVTTDMDQPLILLWAVVTIWTAVSVWQLDAMRIKKKLHLFAAAFLSMYLYAAVAVLSLLRSGWTVLKYPLRVRM